MYTQSITRSHRTAFILAIDQSGSMAEKLLFRGRQTTKAEAVAEVTNRLLFELIERARRSDEVRDYYDIAVLGYSGDGFFYRKKDVAVVGGGDTACEEATYLASICRQVYLIVRKPYLRASKAMQERVMNTPNIKVLFEHNTAEVLGDETGVTGALLRDNKGTETKIDIAGFFVAIGHHPNTEIFADQLELDAEGYIKTVAGSSRTSVEGVFAAGDVQDPHYRQAITAAGSGCMAALDCERFLLQ